MLQLNLKHAKSRPILPHPTLNNKTPFYINFQSTTGITLELILFPIPSIRFFQKKSFFPDAIPSWNTFISHVPNMPSFNVTYIRRSSATCRLVRPAQFDKKAIINDINYLKCISPWLSNTGKTMEKIIINLIIIRKPGGTKINCGNLLFNLGFLLVQTEVL